MPQHFLCVVMAIGLIWLTNCWVLCCCCVVCSVLLRQAVLSCLALTRAQHPQSLHGSSLPRPMLLFKRSWSQPHLMLWRVHKTPNIGIQSIIFLISQTQLLMLLCILFTWIHKVSAFGSHLLLNWDSPLVLNAAALPRGPLVLTGKLYRFKQRPPRTVQGNFQVDCSLEK